MATIPSDQILSKLFNFKKSMVVRGITFHMRVVPDSIVDDARTKALLESRKLRRELRDVNTNAYLVHLDVLQDFTDDELKNLITVNASRDVMREFIQKTPRPIIPPLGDNPSQEQQEDYEAARNEREDAYFAELETYMDSWQKTFRDGLDKRDREYYLFIARRYQTDAACEQLFTEVFEDEIVSRSLYTDDKFKTRLFDSVEAYKELPAEIKKELRDQYQALTVGADEIKN